MDNYKALWFINLLEMRYPILCLLRLFHNCNAYVDMLPFHVVGGDCKPHLHLEHTTKPGKQVNLVDENIGQTILTFSHSQQLRLHFGFFFFFAYQF